MLADIGKAMRRAHLEILEKPKGKERARAGANGHHYTPTAQVVAEDWIRLAWQRSGHRRFDGWVRIHIICHLKRPPSHFTKTGGLSAVGRALPFPGRPDVDNAAKTVLDALQRMAFENDSRVVRLATDKVWGREDKWEIWISEAGS